MGAYILNSLGNSRSSESLITQNPLTSNPGTSWNMANFGRHFQVFSCFSISDVTCPGKISLDIQSLCIFLVHFTYLDGFVMVTLDVIVDESGNLSALLWEKCIKEDIGWGRGLLPSVSQEPTLVETLVSPRGFQSAPGLWHPPGRWGREITKDPAESPEGWAVEEPASLCPVHLVEPEGA